jgi:high affinity Mn2+ porin
MRTFASLVGRCLLLICLPPCVAAQATPPAPAPQQPQSAAPHTTVQQDLQKLGNPRVPTPSYDAASTRASASEAQPVSTMFPHPDSTWWWVSGQANIIFQAHPGFHSPYQGANSFRNAGEYKTSMVGTLYLGARLYHSAHTNSEFFYHEETAAGRGLGQALGLAGFTNLDVVRNPTLGPTPYTARAEIHETIGFGAKQENITDERGP